MLTGGIEGAIVEYEIDVKIDVAPIQQSAAWQPQIDPVVEYLVGPVRSAVIVDLHEIAFVDILGREEETVVVCPHGALDLAEIACDVDETAIAVGSRCARIGGLGIDLVAPGKRRAPAIVVERAGEVVRVGGAVALRTVMRIVEMELGLVVAEAVVVLGVDRRVVVGPEQDGLTITALDEHERQGPAREPAGAPGPDGIRILRREIGVEPGVGCELAPCRHVADLGEELVPALMGEHLAGWAALDRSSPGYRISESRVGRIGAEVGVVG